MTIQLQWISADAWAELERKHPRFFADALHFSLLGELDYLERFTLRHGANKLTTTELRRLGELREWRRLQGDSSE